VSACQTEIYMNDETYDGLVEAILNAAPCAWSGKVEKDQIKLVLGEVGDVWPAAIGPRHKSPGFATIFPIKNA
jgi:hypothetical protein